jgi:hypothetical protein
LPVAVFAGFGVAVADGGIAVGLVVGFLVGAVVDVILGCIVGSMVGEGAVVGVDIAPLVINADCNFACWLELKKTTTAKDVTNSQ